MSKTIAIRLALGGLLLVGAAACNGDDKKTADRPPSAPPTVSTPSAATGTPTPPTTAPTTSAPATPEGSPTGSDLPRSKQIVMIDPDGERYTFTKMAQAAASMRAIMGKRMPADYCEKSYRKGLEEGGSFPAGRDAFLAACRWGVRLAATHPR
jgi:hypothetical protein